MSGIALSDVCVNLFNHIKTRSSFKWLSYKIDDAGAEVRARASLSCLAHSGAASVRGPQLVPRVQAKVAFSSAAC